MTNEQLDDLERLARAASRGPWEWYAGTTLLSPDAQVLAIDLPEFICDEDKAYLAAANPDAVLALIARVRGLEAEPVFRDVSEMEPPDGGSGPAFGQSGMAYWRERALAAEADRDRLAAEVERLRAATTWQPIETAPKDGTWIVAVGRLRHNPVMWRACVTRWSHYGPPVYAEGWSFSAPGYADLFDPEWWLPQPEPRAALAEAATPAREESLDA